MTWTAFEQAVADAVTRLGPSRLRAVGDHIADGWPREATIKADPDAAPILDAFATIDPAAALAYLNGIAAGYAQRAAEISIETVWSGPDSHRVPVRATAQVLTSLVDEAQHELLLMTYSAKPYPPLTQALTKARGRGVRITAVVETLQGAGSALGGAEPYTAFTQVSGIDLWHWPKGSRQEPTSKMHAKLAIADRRILLVTSANLTQSGVAKNIETGLLVRGGTAPTRAAEHIEALQTSGILERLD
jgi:phosphatidylserine/phosphatidylglycerophosphate/cardiolipin synthase-like enzyme